jgi:hypothetical protein
MCEYVSWLGKFASLTQALNESFRFIFSTVA